MTYPTSICTLDDVKAQLSIDLSDTSHDALLQKYIDGASATMDFVSGTILPQVFTDEVHNGGVARIVLHNAPILEVASITEYWGITPYTLTESERGGDITTYGYSIDNPDQGLISRVWSGIVGPFVDGINNVVVTYTAGYATVPPDVFLATVQDIQVLFQQSQYGSGASPYGSGVGTNVNEEWSPATPLNAFPRLLSLLTGNRKVQTIA